MAHTLPFPPVEAAVQLDAERLDVYRVALEAEAAVTALIPADQRVLRDQLERASLSTVLKHRRRHGPALAAGQGAALCHRARQRDGVRRGDRRSARSDAGW